MSKQVVRASKFRHVYGQLAKREQCYDGIRISKMSWDSHFVAVNPKFLAVIIESVGGGSFIVIPLSQVGKVDKDAPMVSGHRGPVYDIQWCPHNDNVIASASDDCTVKIWQIADDVGKINITDPVVDLVGHRKKSFCLKWHPSAANVLLSVGADNLVLIWDVGMGEVLFEIDSHPDLIFDADWNSLGDKIVTVCKDKMIRVFEARTSKELFKGKGHEGTKPQRCIFLKDDAIFTTGFSRMSERQYALRTPETLFENEPIIMEELDTSNSVMLPFYDADTNLIFLTAKGDAGIKYFEVSQEYPYIHYINTFQATDSCRGLGFISKRGVNVNTNEIASAYKDDLYPETASDIPALTAEEWKNGRDEFPLTMSLKEGYVSGGQKELKVTKKENVLNKLAHGGASHSAGAEVSNIKFDALTKDVKDLKESISDFDALNFATSLKEIKDTLNKFELRLIKVESRLKKVESTSTSS